MGPLCNRCTPSGTQGTPMPPPPSHPTTTLLRGWAGSDAQVSQVTERECCFHRLAPDGWDRQAAVRDCRGELMISAQGREQRLAYRQMRGR